jgi:hypothetical protein
MCTTASELEDFLPQQALYWHLLADFPSFFWRLATLTHFMGVATLYVATLTRSNFEPVATLTSSNYAISSFDP